MCAGNRRVSERDMSRIGADMKPPLPMHAHQLPNSKSTPALHHVGNQSMCFASFDRSVDFSISFSRSHVHRYG